MSRSEKWIQVVILLAAVFLRTQYLLQIEHNIDHAYPVWQALQTIEHADFPLTGQSTSVLFANPALTGYLYLPFVALTHSPLGTYILVIALNTLAVLLAFRAVRTILGVPSALISAALMAVNPWVIEYSRTSWVQSLLPFFACAIAWLLWPVLLGQSRQPMRRTVLALVMLTLMAQTYLLAFLMAIPVGALLVIFRRRVPRRGVLIGVAIFFVALAIYAAALWAQRGSVEQRLDEFSSRPASLSAEAWGHAVRLVSGGDYALARGQVAPAGDGQLRQDLSQIAHYAMLAALLVGIGRAIFYLLGARLPLPDFSVEAHRRAPLQPITNEIQQRDSAVIVLVWFGLPVLLMSYVGQPVHPFYQLLGLPAGYALAAWGLTTIFQPHTQVGRIALIVLGLPFAVLMGLNSARYYQETAAIPGAHDTGALPLDYGLRLGRAINAHLPPSGVIYADETQWTLNSFAGRTFPVIRDARAPEFNIVPPEGGLYLAAHSPGSDSSIMPALASRAESITLPDGWVLTLDVLAAESLNIAHPLEYSSEEGITLLGYDLEKAQSGYILTTYWRVDATSEATSGWFFAPFAHVFDESGARVLIVDGALVPGSEWRVGDLHAHRMTVSLPSPGTYSLKIGQYDAANNRNVIFLPDYEALILIPDMLSPD